MSNKVEFGISQLHVGTYTEDENGNVTMGAPYHQRGAVSYNPEIESEKTDFFADNVAYFSDYSDGAAEGDLVVAMYSDDFKTRFLGYRTLADGGLAQIRNVTKPKTYVAFQVEGDAESRRVIYYNCSFGSINKEFKTVEENKEVATETLPVTANGDSTTGAIRAVYKPGDAGYDTLFTAPAAPSFTPESE